MATGSVELLGLVGPHALSGVDFEDPDRTYGCAVVMRFVLDGQIYVAIEDEDDGYRSALGSLEMVDGPPVANTFAPVAVLAVSRGAKDTVEFIDVESGQVVLEVGTDYSDDYYPSFVSGWWPDRLSVNETKTVEPEKPRQKRGIDFNFLKGRDR